MATSGEQGRPLGVPDFGFLQLSWQIGLLVGLVTLGLGIVVTYDPTTSINVIAVLLGVLLIVSGILHLIRALDREANSRAWAAVVGLAFVVLGVVMIRHLHLTRSLIALLIGIIWIVQGVAELLLSAEPGRPARLWTAFFGLISLAAGIVVVAVPTGSLKTLAVLLGIWFIVIGLLEIIGALAVRSAANRS